MGLLKSIFTWWDGATIGTRLFTSRSGKRIGADGLGNVYFEGGTDTAGHARRWVIYAGPNDASRVPPDWHAWLHHYADGPPDQSLPPSRRWESPPQANLTGTREAYRPAGALEAGGVRAAATGDYEAWSPDAA
jgi:NADH:ubiquinone oxidoreductase subunit